MKNQEIHEPIPEHGPETNPEVKYEQTDASAGMVIGSLAVIWFTLVITAILTFPIQNLLKKANPQGNLPSPLAPERVIPPAPRVEVQPWNTFPTLVRSQNKVLAEGGPDATGFKHIPIDQAMTQVQSQLQVRPDAPQGVTVPGGQGLEFSHSLNELPQPYQQIEKQQVAPPSAPSIKGEIRKNVQQ